MRILIVEDEPLLASRLATTLGERGYVVDIAADESAATFASDGGMPSGPASKS